jgi:hypothetical protein
MKARAGMGEVGHCESLCDSARICETAESQVIAWELVVTWRRPTAAKRAPSPAAGRVGVMGRLLRDRPATGIWTRFRGIVENVHGRLARVSARAGRPCHKEEPTPCTGAFIFARVEIRR